MRALCIVALLLLAGCSDPPPPPESADPTPSISEAEPEPVAIAEDTTESVAAPTVTSQDCAGFAVYAPIQMADAQARLPEGFTPTDFGDVLGSPATGLAQEYAFMFACGGATLDNQTFAEVRYGFSGVGATSSTEYGGVTGYTMEALYTDHGGLAAALAGRLAIQEHSIALDMTCLADDRGCTGMADMGDHQTRIVPAAPQSVPPFEQHFWVVEGGIVLDWVHYLTLSQGEAQLGAGTLDDVPGIGMAITWSGEAHRMTTLS